MRAVIVGAVESTRIALRTIAAQPGWTVSALVTLPPDLAARHSDFADMRDDAKAASARIVHAGDSNAPEILGEIERLAPDIVFVIGWSQICKPAFLAAARDRVVGYHPAPLPRLRGRGVLPWTILLAEPITAGTLFWIDEGVDTGPMLAQRFLHVGAEESVGSLYARHLDVLAALLEEALPKLADGETPRIAQDEQHASWAAKRIPGDGEIDWSRPAVEVARLVRAVGRPYPGARTTARGEQLTIWSAVANDASRHAAAVPGQVVAIDAHGFHVRCGSGLVAVAEWESGSMRRPAQHSRLGHAA